MLCAWQIAEGYPNAIHTDPASGATTNLLKLDVDRGMSAELAMSKLATFREHNTETDGRSSGPGSGTGFWISTQTRNACQTHKPLVCKSTSSKISYWCYCAQVACVGGAFICMAAVSPEHALLLLRSR